MHHMNKLLAQAAAAAQNELSEALALLNAARTAYEEQAGAQYAGHKAALAAIDAKIEAALSEQEEAEADFQREFAAAGFEKTAAVAAALGRRNDVQAMSEAMMAGRARTKAALIDVTAKASAQGRSYIGAYNKAQDAYALAQAFEALQSPAGATIARALALVSHVPDETTLLEDFAGRPWHNQEADEAMRRARAAFVFEELWRLAKETPAFSARPAFEGLGALDLSPMPPAEFITPSRAHRMRHGLGGAPVCASMAA